MTVAGIPYRYEPDATASELAERFPDSSLERRPARPVTVAGRLMLRRVQGKLVLGTLQDSTGRVRLFAPAPTPPEFEAIGSLTLGDWLGVRGEVMTTRRGELSVLVDAWVMLAEEARCQFPDKWHGITDPDTRYRQRYVDLWVTGRGPSHVPDPQPGRLADAPLPRGPWLPRGRDADVPPDPGAAPPPDRSPRTTTRRTLALYLRIAPELYPQAALSSGASSGCSRSTRNFRNEGIDATHNPESMML